MTLSRARRLALIDGKLPPYADFQPGDYAGPVIGYDADLPAVFFLLPIEPDEQVDPGLRSLHHVCEPPHSFRECEDGSLEIRESIMAHGYGDARWHGYLDQGNVWRKVP